MDILNEVVSGLIGILLVSVIAGILFLLVYGILTLLHISVTWAIRITATLLLVGCAAFGVFVAIQSRSLQTLDPLQEPSSSIGFLSFLVACYSLGQWVSRRWYLVIKKANWGFLVKVSRNILLILRKHHPLFGWLVFATATAHMLVYTLLVVLQPHSTPKLVTDVITGTIAWIVLLGLIMLGLQVERIIKQNAELKRLRWIHFITALVFAFLVVIHVCFK